MRIVRIDGRTAGAQSVGSDHGASRRRVGDSEEGEAGSRACRAVAGRGQGKPEWFSLTEKCVHVRLHALRAPSTDVHLL